MAHKRSKRLSIEDHTALGEALYAMRNRVIALTMANADGLCIRETDTLLKIYKAIDKARDVLEERAFKDHPRKASIDLYYGHREDA